MLTVTTIIMGAGRLTVPKVPDWGHERRIATAARHP
jgi:cation diffusion facilitator CzcD-associated flavoprotein CzcO